MPMFTFMVIWCKWRCWASDFNDLCNDHNQSKGISFRYSLSLLNEWKQVARLYIHYCQLILSYHNRMEKIILWIVNLFYRFNASDNFYLIYWINGNKLNVYLSVLINWFEVVMIMFRNLPQNVDSFHWFSVSDSSAFCDWLS